MLSKREKSVPKGHASTYRIYLKKSGANRIARLAKSSKDPVEDVKFQLTDKGVEDIK